VSTKPGEHQNVDPFYDLIGPLLEGTFQIFVSTFIAFFLFNKLCHYWGGIEFELSEVNISNQKIKADD
jgi:fatty-acid desaturase